MTKVQPALVPASGSLDILFARDGKGEKEEEEVLVWWGPSLAPRRLCAEITDIINRAWTGRASRVVAAVTRNLPANAIGPPGRGP